MGQRHTWVLAGHAERAYPPSKGFTVQQRARAGQQECCVLPPSHGHGWALLSCSSQLAGDKHLFPGGRWGSSECLGGGWVVWCLLVGPGCPYTWGSSGRCKGGGCGQCSLHPSACSPWGSWAGTGPCPPQIKGPSWAQQVLPGSLAQCAAPALGWEQVTRWGDSPQAPLSSAGSCGAGQPPASAPEQRFALIAAPRMSFQSSPARGAWGPQAGWGPGWWLLLPLQSLDPLQQGRERAGKQLQSGEGW